MNRTYYTTCHDAGIAIRDVISVEFPDYEREIVRSSRGYVVRMYDGGEYVGTY